MDASDAVRAAAVDGLGAIGKKHREARQAAIDPMLRPWLNSIELNAVIVQALPAIKKAFLEQQVDLLVVTWDEVKDALASWWGSVAERVDR